MQGQTQSHVPSYASYMPAAKGAYQSPGTAVRLISALVLHLPLVLQLHARDSSQRHHNCPTKEMTRRQSRQGLRHLFSAETATPSGRCGHSLRRAYSGRPTAAECTAGPLYSLCRRSKPVVESPLRT